jgi:predicted phage-related endonuclease
MKVHELRNTHEHRRSFIGGSDARIIMGQDEKALIRLWQEKRGEVGPEDLSGNLIVQLGLATEDLNRVWYERNTGRAITAVQTRVKHPVIAFMAATLDGVVAGTGAAYEAKFMLPWSFSGEAAVEKYMAQLQHNMWVTNAGMAALSIITGGGQMGGDRDRRRSALPAPAADGGEEVLALRPVRRSSSPVRGRPAAAAHRGGSERRHGILERLGGVRRAVLLDPDGLPRP